MWVQAKAEIQAPCSNHPTFDSAFQKVFGFDSRLFHLFKTRLDVDYETFCKFFASFFVTSCHRHRLAELEKDPRVDTSDLLPEERFKQIWRSIASSKAAYRTKAFWIELKSFFNDDALDL